MNPSSTSTLVSIVTLFSFISRNSNVINVKGGQFIATIRDRFFTTRSMFPHPFTVNLRIHDQTSMNPFSVIILTRDLWGLDNDYYRELRFVERVQYFNRSDHIFFVDGR